MTPLPLLSWANFEPRFSDLERETLTPSSADAWLERWSNLTAEVQEAYKWRMRTYHENTQDSAAEASYNTFLQEVMPRLSEVEQRLKRKLLLLEGYAPPLERRMLLKRFQNEAALFREENVLLESEVQLLKAEFEKLQASREVSIREESLSVQVAQKRLLEPDRASREAAWRGLMDYSLGLAPETDALFGKLLERRRQQAQNAGLPDFLEYVWRVGNRFDYTPEQARELHESVKLEVVPLLRDLLEERRRALDLERLRPWDAMHDPKGRNPLKPFSSVNEFEDGLERIFGALDPELGEMFTEMRATDSLNLEDRTGKIPGMGYSTVFPQSKRSYIYWSATGADWDVSVMLHEAGHAFNTLSSLSTGLLVWDIYPPLEFAEVASQAMELLALPLLERPIGFYSPEDAARARRDELESLLRVIVAVSLDDAFQHWLYRQPNVTVADLDAKMLELAEAYSSGMIDWSGFERERAKGWQTGHIVTRPLYMLEYAIAWLGALQLWRNSLENPKKALEQYKFALSLGGTRPLPELFEAAGIRFAFDRATVRELMDFVRGQLERVSS